MKAYIFTIIFTILFTFIAEKCFFKKHKFFGIIFSILAIFVMCFVAAVRDLDIGKDIYVYVTYLYNLFTNVNCSIIRASEITGVEIGFSTLVYLSALTKNINVCLFFIEFAVCVPIYLFAYQKRDKISMTFVIFIFLLTMYCRSLNLMRQCIAISLLIYSFVFIDKRKYKACFLVFLLACTFHISAGIGILMYVTYYICNMNSKDKYIYILIMALCFTILTITFVPILKALPVRFSHYVNSKYAGVSSVDIMSTIKQLFWMCFGFLYLSGYKIKNDNNYNEILFAQCLLLWNFILYFMGSRIGNAGRLGYYFLYPGYFMLIPKIKDCFKQKIFMNIVICSILIFFWYNMTVVNYSVDGVYPYHTPIVDILN